MLIGGAATVGIDRGWRQAVLTMTMLVMMAERGEEPVGLVKPQAYWRELRGSSIIELGERQTGTGAGT